MAEFGRPSDGISDALTRMRLGSQGPPLLMYAPGGFNAILENWSIAGRLRQDQAARPSAEEIHLHRVRPARVRPVRRPRRGGDLGALRRAGQGPARSPRHQARASDRRLHGLLPGHGVRRRASTDGAEHGAVVAGRRREVPHRQPPALRRASRVRAAGGPRRSGRAGGEGRQDVRRRSARRAVGVGDQARPRVRGRLRPAERRHLPGHRRPP